MPRDAGLALALTARASGAGDPGAQFELGVALATGATPVGAVGGGPGDADAGHDADPDTSGARAARAGALHLSPPDWPAALAHYYFAAAGNDTLAQMALGARHAAGLGVPK